MNFYSLSMATYPVLPLSIAAYNYMIDALEDQLAKIKKDEFEEHQEDLMAGILAAKKKLEKWYSRTKRPVYGNAMCE